MSAYIVFHNLVTDPEKLQQYLPTALETLMAHGVETLVVSETSTILEGTPSFPRTVVLKFPSRAAAREWYDSPEYQKVLPLRLQATEGYAVLVDGYDPVAS